MINKFTRMLLYATLSLLSCSAGARAQTAFQDASGESSIFIREGGGFSRINVGDKSISLGYLLDRGDDRPYFGLELTGKRAGDFASIFDGSVPGNEAKINASIGKRFVFVKPPTAATAGQIIVRRVTLDWLTFQGGYKRSRYKLFNDDPRFANQVRKQNFDGYSATLGYNALIDLSGDDDDTSSGSGTAEDSGAADNSTPSSMIVGISLGVQRRNNADDLDTVDVEDQIFTSTSGTTERRVLSKQQALRGEYKESTAVPLNADAVLYPGRFQGRIALDFFVRSNLGEGGRNFVPGIGLFYTKKGAPTKVLGGISIAARDGKAQVGLVAGFHF
ncbi:MAG TPA: hypothetical protein VGW12_08065 [Pyrinomonadaceae bacterium]|nr:hypothetical protein [Pyrinomonadaceae bacterium]